MQHFKVFETTVNIYYIVEGSSTNAYEVIYNKYLERYHCNCGNVRPVDCKHIKFLKSKQENVR